ncbi:MAG: copper-containing nitrite reductase [Gallionellaceae bacterium]|nr:copper-containing nitrite reductase [Gallionellaceae bacterium]
MKVSAIIGAMSLSLLAFGSSASWAAAGPAAVDIHQDPTAVGTPVGKRGPTTVKFHLTAKEVVGVLEEKTTFNYWTFDGKVPGPMLRARVGDTIELTLSNDKTSAMYHNIDLHAVWGQGGGAEATKVAPGESKTFTFKALHAGLFVYHCATAPIPQHISNGMYGMILIEPEGGLKPAKEFYMMQGDMYVDGAGARKEFNMDKMSAEQPTHVVINGAPAALAANPMKVKVGDEVRVFFGVGGPNLTSSFHAIGTIFDRVYKEASLTSPPSKDVQTTSVPPGGATMVEFNARVPAKYIFVDHALGRLSKGAVAIMQADGPQKPEWFKEGPADGKAEAKPAKK